MHLFIFSIRCIVWKPEVENQRATKVTAVNTRGQTFALFWPLTPGEGRGGGPSLQGRGEGWESAYVLNRLLS